MQPGRETLDVELPIEAWKERLMVPLTRILLPVDFSNRSLGAARYAGMLACRFQAELTILHVLPTSDYWMGSVEAPASYDWRAEAVRYARQGLDSFASEAFPHMTVGRIVQEGDAAIKIVGLAHSEGVNLIVMPTHGYGPFRRFILGSVTAKVLHDADCPVFTGTHLEEEAPPASTLFRNILCAVDLEARSRAVLDWAAGMAAELGAGLHLVHALPSLGAGQTRYFDPAWNVELERGAREQIGELQEQAGTHADVIIESDEVPSVVRNGAKRVNADLVVIGRHAGSGLLGRLRAHAYAIVRESPCPVVSV